METRDSFSGITPSNISSHGVAVLVLAVGPRPELPRDVLADLPDVGQAQLVVGEVRLGVAGDVARPAVVVVLAVVA